MALERQLQQAIRDAVHRPSRKPFSWGGSAGYQQLSAIADGIRQLVDETSETRYLRRLLSQVERALENYQALAKDLTAAHDRLRRVATVLHYPHPAGEASSEKLSSQSVAQVMTALLATFQPDFKRQPAQAALYHALARTWDVCGQIPALLRYQGAATGQSGTGSNLLRPSPTPATHLATQIHWRTQSLGPLSGSFPGGEQRGSAGTATDRSTGSLPTPSPAD